jgi:hypothetical protein
MILVVLTLVCMLTVPFTGGNLVRLTELRLRWLWAAPGALALQVLIVIVAASADRTLLAALHVVSYVIAAAFLWANREIPGVRVLALGMLANAIAIVSNGGVMPASITAQRIAGLTYGPGFHNSAAIAHPHLLWLGDIIPVPGPMPNVLSVGDCIIFTGLLILLHRTCRRAKAPVPALETSDTPA